MKQTAVEWYSDKLLEIIGESVNSFTTEQTLANHYALKQAKEMEKEQIIEAFDRGLITDNVYYGYDDKKAEKFYNKTFKSE